MKHSIDIKLLFVLRVHKLTHMSWSHSVIWGGISLLEMGELKLSSLGILLKLTHWCMGEVCFLYVPPQKESWLTTSVSDTGEAQVRGLLSVAPETFGCESQI